MPISPAKTRSCSTRSSSCAGVGERVVGEPADGDAERAQRLAGQRVVRVAGSRARRSAVSGRASSPTSSCVQRAEQHVGRALGEDEHAVLALGVAMHGAHQLALGRERHLADARRTARRAPRRSRPALRAATSSAPSVGSPCTVQRPSRSLQRRRCSRGRRRRARARARRAARRRSAPPPSLPHLAVGRVARCRSNVDAPAGGDDHAHGHLVPRQRAGLVGGDHGRRAERLDRGEVPHDRVAPRHALHAEREHRGDDRRQPSGTAATASATPRISTSKSAGSAAHVLDER